MAYQIIASQDTDAVYPETELRPRITAVLDSAADVEALGGTEKWSPGSLAILAEAGFPTLLLSKSNGWVNGNTGGSGGGSGLPSGSKPNQYIVTDGEGNAKWEDKLCWIEKEVVLEEQTIHLGNRESYTVTEVGDIVAGKSYVVGYQGNEYNCVAMEFIMEGYTVPILGNSFVLADDEVDSGEPFAYVSVPQEVAAQLGFSGYFSLSDRVLDEGWPESIVASIRCETIHPIDKKYLSKTVIYAQSGGAYLYHDAEMTRKFTATELLAVMQNNVEVVLFNDDLTYHCYPVGYGDNIEGFGVIVWVYTPNRENIREYHSEEYVEDG